MIRKIYSIITLAGAFTTLASCSDWLDIYPADEIKEEYLFSTGDGYRTALNGIYRKMSTFDLYGSNLSWGLIDAWGQVYYIDQAPDNGGGKAMKKIAALNFKNSELVPTTDAMWNAAWNIVANCNELAQKTASADSTLFRRRDWERKMILGEAIGLRAFMQFDLLRVYAPAPSSVGFADDKRTFIPYVDSYPSYVNNHQTVAYCLDKIIKDLTEAQTILLDVDKTTSLGSGSRFQTSTSGENAFYGARGYRLNYYAVTAELARVYLYAGKNKEAYAEAKKIIDEEQDTGYFKASTSSYNFENGNMKMTDDVIFALYSPTELVDWDYEINRTSADYYLCQDAGVVDDMYGKELDTDFRAKYLLESVYYGYYYRPLKYKQQADGLTYAQVNNQTIPMLRMSEVYYIAAEAIYDTNPTEALGYLSLVKKGRGIRNADLSGVTNKETFLSALMSDARREFTGEGQTLFMYKRMNKPVKASSKYSDDFLPTDDKVVLPQPESENNIK